MDVPQTPAVRVRALRAAHGWSLDRLAKELGTSRQTVVRWEKHGVEPNEEFRIKLAALDGCNPDDYRYPEGEKPKTAEAMLLEELEASRQMNQEIRDLMLELRESLQRLGGG